MTKEQQIGIVGLGLGLVLTAILIPKIVRAAGPAPPPPPPPPPTPLLKFDLDVPPSRRPNQASLGEEFDFSLTLENVGTAPLSYSVQFALDGVYFVDELGNRLTYEGMLDINESETISQTCVVTEYPGYIPRYPLFHNIRVDITYDGKRSRHSQGFVLLE